MTLKDYPYWPAEKQDDVKSQLREICSIRKDDITQFQNLPSIYVGGRKVERVPRASNDVQTGDKVGDFNVTATYAYWLINNAGTGEWRRITVSSW